MGHPFLLGPPEIHLPPTAGNPNPDIIAGKPLVGLLEGHSPTFLPAGNRCLDFFFHVNPDTPPENLTHRLEVAWKHDPLTTLKLICQLRGGVRGGARKSDKEGFYAAAIWLHQNHPLTLSCNVVVFGGFGHLKDLLEILYRLLEGPEVSRITKEERERAEEEKGRERKRKSHCRRRKDVVRAKRAVERYRRDPNYRFLHNRISEQFAELLKLDIKFLNTGETRKISLASKWCPSIDSSYDKSTLICESIARKVFPRDSCPEYEGIEEAHYAYRVRNRLCKQVLIPLRKEIHMSSKWRPDSLPKNRVTSVAMKAYKTYKNLYLEHDEEMFFKHYLEIVAKCGKATIGEGLLLPHRIISIGKQVAELQWRRLVEDFSKKGKLRNSLAVCDLSESMRGTTMEDVCIAMGLLISELNEHPWKGKVFSFSDYPKLRNIEEDDDLQSKTEFVRELECGKNTDFQNVYDRILQVAITEKISKEKTVKRIFVFSDKEFEKASKNNWVTDYRAAWKSFRQRGYKTVPEIVFWNLKDAIASPVVYSSPVDSKHKGVTIITGFSNSLLSVFLEGDGVMKLEDVKKLVLVPEPEDVMKSAISGEEYQNLVVFD